MVKMLTKKIHGQSIRQRKVLGQNIRQKNNCFSSHLSVKWLDSNNLLGKRRGKLLLSRFQINNKILQGLFGLGFLWKSIAKVQSQNDSRVWLGFPTFQIVNVKATSLTWKLWWKSQTGFPEKWDQSWEIYDGLFDFKAGIDFLIYES